MCSKWIRVIQCRPFHQVILEETGRRDSFVLVTQSFSIEAQLQGGISLLADFRLHRLPLDEFHAVELSLGRFEAEIAANILGF
jgi:hypothetical protein